MYNFVVRLKNISEFALDLIFPKECLSCGQEGFYLCAKCFKQIKLNNKNYCALCKRKTFLSQICQTCQKNTNLRAVWITADYNNEILQNLIHNLKYKYVEEISQILADLIIKYLGLNKIFLSLKIDKDNSIITAVPLHKKRYLMRGFNQSELLARKVSNYYKIPAVALLKRKINTASQINLKRKERQANVKKAFIYKPSKNFVKNKKIIIIDDVITSGSTLNECAKVLSEAGFKEIYGLVIAQRED